MKTKKLVYFSIMLAFALLFAVGGVYAADFRMADKNAGNVQFGQGEVVKNLYTAGNIISIDGNVEKGAYVAGNMVTINGNVGGSMHGVGGSVVVNGVVADDLLMAGGNVVVSSSAMVGGDLIIGGGTVDIQGPVRGSVLVGGGVVSINSEIGGNVKIKGADKIKLGSNVKINGNLEYNSKTEIEKEAGAVVVGETKRLEGMGTGKTGKSPDRSKIAAIIFAVISIAALVKLGGPIVIGLLMVYFLKTHTENVVKESLNNFWKSLGYGFLYIVVTPVVVVLLMITLIGILPGIIVALFYALSIMLASVLASITFGSWAWGVIKKNKDYNVDWKIVVGGVIAFAIIKSFPVLGGIFGCVFVLASLGAVYQLVCRAIRQ